LSSGWKREEGRKPRHKFGGSMNCDLTKRSTRGEMTS